MSFCSVKAEPIRLHCISSDGNRTVDLIIDMEKKMMQWGSASQYSIVDISKKFVTAYQKPNGVPGGEVWVMNRQTGEYTRALAAEMFHYWQEPEQAKLKGRIHEGRCSRGNPLKKPVAGKAEF